MCGRWRGGSLLPVYFFKEAAMKDGVFIGAGGERWLVTHYTYNSAADQGGVP
jgi:hypothetical protein